MPLKSCPRRKSDMTPCVIVDGSMCYSSDGYCVGCSWSRKSINDWKKRQREQPSTEGMSHRATEPATPRNSTSAASEAKNNNG